MGGKSTLKIYTDDVMGGKSTLKEIQLHLPMNTFT